MSCILFFLFAKVFLIANDRNVNLFNFFTISFCFLLVQIGKILAIDNTKLTRACLQLKVRPFEDEEYGFLCEYHRVMKLIAMTLKSIEADSYTFALYLPTLLGLRINLQSMIDSHTLLYCEPLVVALQRGLEAIWKFDGSVRCEVCALICSNDVQSGI